MSNIKTFSDLSKGDDDRPNQEYYVGGSSSGSVVSDPQGMREEMIQAARQSADHQARQAASVNDGWGSGHQVGALMEGAPHHQQKEVPKVVITLYLNGFTIDDGEFRPFENNPQNRHFIDCLKRGEIPPELAQQGREISVDFIVKNTEYTEPVKPPSRTKFASSFSVAPSSSSSSSSSSSPSSDLSSIKKEIVINEKEKVTQIQVRLVNGKKATFRANLTHTVGDLYYFAQQQNNIPSFLLFTPMPRKELLDKSQTLGDAGLINCVVIQSKT